MTTKTKEQIVPFQYKIPRSVHSRIKILAIKMSERFDRPVTITEIVHKAAEQGLTILETDQRNHELENL